MRFSKTVATTLLITSMALSGCADMSTRQKNAAVGAAVGGVAGAVLTGGSSFGTVGGAAIGGIIGHGVDGFTSKKKAPSSPAATAPKKSTAHDDISSI